MLAEHTSSKGVRPYRFSARGLAPYCVHVVRVSTAQQAAQTIHTHSLTHLEQAERYVDAVVVDGVVQRGLAVIACISHHITLVD
mgnify:CR=1 FL=1